MKFRLLIIALAGLMISSCGKKEYTACECQKVVTGKEDASGVKFCTEKMAKDAKFAEEVTKCAAESMGFKGEDVKMATGPQKADAGKYTVNTEKSTVKWTGRKMVGKHNGEVAIKSGAFNLDEEGNLTNGMITMDMTSISVTDIEDEKSNADLVGHLKADDFFGSDKYAEATYKLVSAEAVDASKTGFKIKGELTIKGVTQPVESILLVTKSQQIEGNVGVTGALTFDRTKFGIVYKGMADNMIKDDVSLQITLVAS